MLLMLILGGNIYADLVYEANNNTKRYTRDVIRFVVIRNIVFPLVFLALLLWLRPDFAVGLIAIL